MKTPEEIRKGFEEILRKNINPLWQFTTSEKISKLCLEFYMQLQEEQAGSTARKRIWVDMDGVLVDFYGAAKARLEKKPKILYPQAEYGFFTDLKPLPGAIEAYKELDAIYDVRILTRPSPMNIGCYSEKAFWVYRNLGFDAQEKMVLACDKSIAIGDWLIDDTTNANQLEFGGQLIKFGSKEFPDWNAVMKMFRKRKDFVLKTDERQPWQTTMK